METKSEVVPKNEAQPKDVEAELLLKQTDQRSIELLGVVAQNLVQPLAESQKVSEAEATKRHEVSVKASLKVVYGAFFVGVLIIVLAYLALMQGNSTLAEKIVVAVISFLAGLGVGRSTSKP